MEQMRYNLLYRWFIGLDIDDDVWDRSTFSKNRDRLLDHEVVEGAFNRSMQRLLTFQLDASFKASTIFSVYFLS